MLTDRPTTAETTALTSEVEDLLTPMEPKGDFRDRRECGAGLILAALLLAAPPTPRPQTETR